MLPRLSRSQYDAMQDYLLSVGGYSTERPALGEVGEEVCAAVLLLQADFTGVRSLSPAEWDAVADVLSGRIMPLETPIMSIHVDDPPLSQGD